MENGESKLPSLPKSDDKFWGEAEKHQVKIASKPNCDHFFVYRSGREVICQKCQIGFFLDEQTFLKGGHIYYKGEFII